MKIISYYIFIVICLAASACRYDKTFSGEINEKGMRLQVSQLKDDAGDQSIISYKIRVIPNKQIADKQTVEEKRAMIFKMDSCFYINGHSNKTYAALVQSVANGVGSSFEYLVEFDLNKSGLDKRSELVYQDRYITHQTYKIKLDEE